MTPQEIVGTGIQGKRATQVIIDEPLPECIEDTHTHPTAFGPTGPPIFDRNGKHVHVMDKDLECGEEWGRRGTYQGEKAKVVFTPDGIHIVIFSSDGDELERYDIQRKRPGADLPLEDRHPKRMSLAEMRKWLMKGCPTKQ